MMDLRDKSQLGTTLASLGAMLALTGVALYMVLVPTPSTLDANRKFKHDRQKLLMDALIARKDVERNKADSGARLWTIPVTEVGPTALGNVTALAKADGIQLLAFRPQKQIESRGLTILPFVISLQGNFAQVAKFERDLETAGRKLAVHLLQISSTDASSDEVSGTIGVTAFCQPPPPPKSSARDKKNG